MEEQKKIEEMNQKQQPPWLVKILCYDGEKKNYEKSKRSIKPTGVYLRRLEQRYMGEQMEIEEMNQTQQSLWLVNNILFCYEGEKHTGSERK